jgi:hypothetical protein
MWDNLSNFIIRYRILSIVIICAITFFMTQTQSYSTNNNYR